MRRIHAIISGEVQGVGYREEVKRISFDLNISGWVMNLEEGSVELIAEGDSKNIADFLDRINIRKYPIFVEEMKVDDEIYKGDIRSFKVKRDKDIQKEILSALSRGTVEIREMKEVLLAVKQDTSSMLEKQDSMLEKQDSMLEKQDSMLEKQDKTIHILQSVNEDTSDMKSILSRMEADVKDTKFSLSSFINEKFRMQEGEIAEIRATLARMQAAG